MKALLFLQLGWLAAGGSVLAQLPVLKRSDVVFMYQSDRQTYADYGGTVLAWGGEPSPQSLEAAQGVKFFGSVGMVTEFARYHDRFPQTYQQGLCRNLEGDPFKVPWLTDHQHKGVPYWWCCTRQPLFRQYLSERVAATVQAGAQGVHIDDHLGTAGSLGNGGCFCDRCLAEFSDYLGRLPAENLTRLGVAEPAKYDYRQVLREWLASNPARKPQQHPLWTQWRIFQFGGAARFMEELRALAARTAGHPVPMGANACVLWGPHLSDYRTLDLFSAEIEHHASSRRFQDGPLVAYRLADAVNRPLAATGSGGDWAFVKEQNLPGLVQGWIALSYAAGHCLMAPNRQWCYTPQKGTHWYAGPKDKFAPLFQFVRRNASLLDGCQNYSDLTVAFSQRTFDRDPGRIMDLCNKLAATNISYRIALGGDEIVPCSLKTSDLEGGRWLLALETNDFMPEDRQLLSRVPQERRLSSLDDVLSKVTPAVRVNSAAPVRVLPRLKPGSTVIHVVNWDYDPQQDSVRPIRNLRLTLDRTALALSKAPRARLHTHQAPPEDLPIDAGQLTIPSLALWAVLEIRTQ